MKVSIDKDTVELKEDGTVVANGKTVGKFVKNEFKSDDGKHTVSVLKNGSILFDGKDEGAKFDAKDQVVGIKKMGALAIADDGTVTATGEDGKDMMKKPVKFSGFKPEGRRAAELLMIVLIATGSDSAEAPPGASATPKATAAPAPTTMTPAPKK